MNVVQGFILSVEKSDETTQAKSPVCASERHQRSKFGVRCTEAPKLAVESATSVGASRNVVDVLGSIRKLLGSVCAFGLATALGCSGRTSGDVAGTSGAPGASGNVAMIATAGSDAGAVAGGAASAGAASSGASSGGAQSGGAAGATASNSGAASGGSASGGAPSAGASSGGAPSMGGASGAGGAGGLPALPDPTEVLKVKPTVGCGKAAIQATAAFVKYTIQTSGTKEPNASDAQTGPWSYARDYYVWLPPNYDDTKAYPLVLEGPGCGGVGTAVYSLSPSNDTTGIGVNGSVIRVGLTPPPNDIGHATNPNQGCFDDKEGDDSVEWPFYEGLIDKLKTEVCYDQNRVFATGGSSGAWLANELVCKYAGNTAGYAIRGAAANAGALPTEPKYAPTCSNAPMAGIWINQHTIGDAFETWPYAIARAMKVNHCTMGTGYADAPSSDFPIGAGNPASTCKKILGCPSEYPLVVCVLPPSAASSSEDALANPGFATFLLGLEAP